MNIFNIHTFSKHLFYKDQKDSKALKINFNLGVGSIFNPLSCWFSLINSETVKSMKLEFCSIKQIFLGDIHAKFGTPYSVQPPNTGQNSDGVISNFQISDQIT